MEKGRQYSLANKSSGKVLSIVLNTEDEAKDLLKRSAYSDKWCIVSREVTYGDWEHN